MYEADAVVSEEVVCSLDQKAEDELAKQRIRRKTIPGEENRMCEVESLAGSGRSGQASEDWASKRGDVKEQAGTRSLRPHSQAKELGFSPECMWKLHKFYYYR